LQVSAPLQALSSAHDVPALRGVPAWHVPVALHFSSPLQKTPSSQEESTGSGVLLQ
jgi:hypothetical protein